MSIYHAIGSLIGRLGVHPNYYTLMGLALSLLVPLVAHYYGPHATAAAILLSGLFDAMDGMVARATGKVTRFGALLDSVSDRFADASYVFALSLLGVDWRLCFALVVLSLIISYTAALAEGLGLRMKGIGILERKNRVPALSLAALLTSWDLRLADYFVAVLSLLSLITIIQRMIALYAAAREER